MILVALLPLLVAVIAVDVPNLYRPMPRSVLPTPILGTPCLAMLAFWPSHNALCQKHANPNTQITYFIPKAVISFSFSNHLLLDGGHNLIR